MRLGARLDQPQIGGIGPHVADLIGRMDPGAGKGGLGRGPKIKDRGDRIRHGVQKKGQRVAGPFLLDRSPIADDRLLATLLLGRGAARLALLLAWAGAAALLGARCIRHGTAPLAILLKVSAFCR